MVRREGVVLTVEGVDLQPVGGGSPVRGPSNAERIVGHVVGGQVRHVQVHWTEGAVVSPRSSRLPNGGIAASASYMWCLLRSEGHCRPRCTAPAPSHRRWFLVASCATGGS